MATNKHAIIRYQALDKCFRNPGRKYFMEDLVEACNQSLYEFSGIEDGIKRRQVYEDIKFMESSQGWNIPLIKIRDGKKVFYRYEDLNFSINNQPLNEREELQLRESLVTLSRFKGMPQFEWVDELAFKLEQGLGLANSDQKIIEFEQNQYLKGLEYITPLYEAIQNKQTLKIAYQNFKQEKETEFLFYPYYLKQYNNRWFVLGCTKGYENLTTLSLDRINQIEQDNSSYQENEKFDFEEYFEDVIGVTVNKSLPLEKIILKVSKALWPYIKNKPIHGSQRKLEENDGYIVLQLELIINYELKSLLFSFMDAIEIVEPTSLRKEFLQIVNTTIKKYT